MLMNDPGSISTNCISFSNRSLAAPFKSNTHSLKSWSYQKPSGDDWPSDTIRSIRRFDWLSRVWKISSGMAAGISAKRLFMFMP